MPHFHALTVNDIRKETFDCVSVGFDVPETLKSEYKFIPGQYLTLKTELDGEEVRRSYSICSSPGEKHLRVAIKKVSGGRFSTFANDQLKVGDTLDVMTPMGRFHTLLKEEQSKSYVAFAAGSGITPVISIMKAVLETEPGSDFSLFYSNKTTDSVIFLEEIENIKNLFLDRLSVHYVFTREDPGTDLFYGRIDEEKCRAFCTKLMDVGEVDEFFICGPEPMIHVVKQTLASLEVDPKKVHFELFTSPAGKLGDVKKVWKPTSLPSLATVTITLDGKTFTYRHNSKTQTILDAAQNGTSELPYACKGGVCCTCKARVLEGDVEMEVNYGLEPEEVEAGYVLTCQSHPKSKKVVLSFDE